MKKQYGTKKTILGIIGFIVFCIVTNGVLLYLGIDVPKLIEHLLESTFGQI